MKYWINTVSKDHVLKGFEAGFTQANHGAQYNLKKLAKGDWIVFYSPKTSYKDGAPLKAFTAIGIIANVNTYQAEMSPDFHPFRRDVKFLKCEEVSILPLIEKLTFIKDKKKWGFSFRRGMFEISKEDFVLISDAMGIDIKKNSF